LLAILRPRRPPRIVIILVGGLTLLVVAFISLVIFGKVLGHYVWGIDRLFRQTPEQPIAFPHPKHVEAGIDCVFCHRLVTTKPTASIPPVQQCYFCHQIIKGSDEVGKQEVGKLVAAFEKGEPINWVRVHRLPDHVRFIHEAHVTFFSKKENYADALGRYNLTAAEAIPSATCAICHGDVAKMQRVSQVNSLKMGNCVDCHRQYGAPTDCTTCHY
jgi:energy-converting hydrogenase Eha subunit A